MSLTRDILTIVAVTAGAFFFLAGTVGLLRFPDTLTRLHALTKADNLGLGLVALGLIIQAESILAACKLIAVWLLVLFASATVSQLIAHSLPNALNIVPSSSFPRKRESISPVPSSSFPRKRESISPDPTARIMDARLRGHDDPSDPPT